jgi:hypothetical protein
MILRSHRNYYSQETLIDVHPHTDKCTCQGHLATSQGQIAQAYIFLQNLLRPLRPEDLRLRQSAG